MRTDRRAPRPARALCVLLALAVTPALAPAPAAADYTHAPFHDRPFEVGDTALRVLAGAPVPVPEGDVPLAAAVAALLLLSEVGLAEAFEEAVEGGDEEDYRAAHALLQTLRPWVEAVPQDAETADLMARLDALMPSPDRPERLDADPEAAEVVAQALVGRLERAADADLYLGRDLGRAMETVAELAAEGCRVADAARERRFEIAALYFEDALEAPLSVVAPDEAEAIEEGLDALRAGDLSACDAVGGAFADARQRLIP